MIFPNEFLSEVIPHCDERIATAQSKLDSCNKLLLFLAGIHEQDEDNTVFKMEANKVFHKIKQLKNNIQLVKVEKVIYQALGKNNNGALFPKLLQKYSDLMADSYELSGNMVKLNAVEEQEHLVYCAKSLKQRDYIERLCLYGERR
jgi:hypothetical protein